MTTRYTPTLLQQAIDAQKFGTSLKDFAIEKRLSVWGLRKALRDKRNNEKGR